MLQQTTVAAIVPRFERFVERWPTIEALAVAADEDILSEWAGLGYYARARNLIACARQVATSGGFPTTESELRELPGIGDYTAAAIAAIAFGQRAVGRRHQCRSSGGPAPWAEESVETANRESRCGDDPDDRPGDFAQAMMDLGATICRPRQPFLPIMPPPGRMRWLLPAEPPKRSPPARSRPRDRSAMESPIGSSETAPSGWFEGHPKGCSAGWPGCPAPNGPMSRSHFTRTSIGRIRHVFTHFALELTLVRRDHPEGDGWWQPLERLQEAGLPTLYRRAADLALRQADQRQAA